MTKTIVLTMLVSVIFTLTICKFFTLPPGGFLPNLTGVITMSDSPTAEKCFRGSVLKRANYKFPKYYRKVGHKDQIKTLKNDPLELKGYPRGRFLDGKFKILPIHPLDEPNKGKHEEIASLKFIDGKLYGSSRHGYLSRINTEGKKRFDILIDMHKRVETEHAESGLLDFIILDKKNFQTFLLYYVERQGATGIVNVLSAVKVGKNKKIVEEVRLIEIDRKLLGEGIGDRGHHGGNMRMKGDILYLALGDLGYSDSSLPQRSQNLESLPGSIIRIRLKNLPGSESNEKSLYQISYEIPKDNPYADKKNVCGEIYSSGFRNPWRFSFDPYSDDLYVGDVGWSDIEEINIAHSGSFHGWDFKEGNNCLEDNPNYKQCQENKFNKYITDPLVLHKHGGKQHIASVIGGDFLFSKTYKKQLNPYIYGDYEGSLHMVLNGKHKLISNYLNRVGHITSMASNKNGKIYFSVYGNPPYDHAKIFVLDYFRRLAG